MARLRWWDTTDTTSGLGIFICRAIDCTHRDLWEVRSTNYSGQEYEDLVCMFHLAAYVRRFYSSKAVFQLERHSQLPKPGRRPNLNDPETHDLSKVLGYINIEHG